MHHNKAQNNPIKNNNLSIKDGHLSNSKNYDNLKAIKEALKQAIPKEEFKDLNIYKEQERKLLFEWKSHKIEAIDLTHIPQYNALREYIKETIKGFIPSTIIVGSGGLGKSVMTIKTLQEELKNPDDWEEITGFTTPLSLFQRLYEFRNKKVLMIDDTEGIFNNYKSISLLKGALWEKNAKRLIQYTTTAKQNVNFPHTFEIKANLIILANRIPREQDISTSAMLSRANLVRIELSNKEILEIIGYILENNKELSEDDKKELFKILKDNITNAVKHFNFRTLDKLICHYKYNPSKAEELFKHSLDIDEDIKIMETAMKIYPHQTTSQITYFMENTGKSRRTFFYIKKKCNSAIKNTSALCTNIGGN